MSRTIRTLVLPALVTVSLLLLGCVPTLNSVFSDDNLVTEPRLVGDFKPANSGEEDLWRFTLGDGKSYRLEQSDKKGTGVFTARLGRFNELLVLELQPRKTEEHASDMHRAYMLPMRTFFVVEQLEPTLKLSAMKMDWLKAHLTENPEALQHAMMDENTVLLTASTDELQAFIAKHRANAEAWAPAELTRVEGNR